MTIQHTPGPWVIEDLPKGLQDGQPILLIKGFSRPEARERHIIAMVEYISDLPQEIQERRNANLIAAAPELLEACKIAYEYFLWRFKKTGIKNAGFSKIENAIAKTEGRL